MKPKKTVFEIGIEAVSAAEAIAGFLENPNVKKITSAISDGAALVKTFSGGSVGDGASEGSSKIQAALDGVWRFVEEKFVKKGAGELRKIGGA